MHGFKTVHNDALESTICHRNGSQTTRVTHTMRTPVFGVRMACVTRAVYEPLRRQINENMLLNGI
eukprot:7297830-Lingulodinium_polyedra.AAC.1